MSQDNGKISEYIRALYLPRNIIYIYLMVTVLLYFFGPVKWDIDNGLTLFIYLFISYVCIWFGYSRCMKKRTRDYEYMENVLYEDDFPYYANLVRLIFVFAIVSHLVYSFYVYGGISLNKALDMAQSYLDNRYSEKHYNIFTQIFTYLWGLNYCYLPCGIVFFKRFRLPDKILFFCSLATDILFWLSIGTMKGIGDIAFTALLPFLAVTVKGKHDVYEIKNTRKKQKQLLLVAAGVVFTLFGYSSANRYLLRGHTTFSAINKQMQPFVISEAMWPFAEATNSLIVNFTHGYTGLAYALKLPFQWTYFVGNSRSLTSIIERTLQTNEISSITYCQRLQDVYGWANGSIWPTAFTWLASDITFVGVPILLILLSYLWAKAICEAIVDNNIISLIFANYLTIFFIYLPMNNQIVQSDRSFYSLILLGILYIVNSSKRVLTIGKLRLRL